MALRSSGSKTLAASTNREAGGGGGSNLHSSSCTTSSATIGLQSPATWTRTNFHPEILLALSQFTILKSKLRATQASANQAHVALSASFHNYIQYMSCKMN